MKKNNILSPLIITFGSGIIVLIIFLIGKILIKEVAYEFIYETNQLQFDISQYLPKICEPRVWEINLSKNLIYFYENCKLKSIIPIAYQAPENVWYKTPTGYYRIGVKKEKHISSIFPVYMNYAVQMYEDFFIHEIPYYLDGRVVEGDFSGGCIRLTPNNAKKFFDLTKAGDFVISYLDLDNIKVKENFFFPVNKDEFYIRQRFNSPIRTAWNNLKDRSIDYSQHAGIDLAPNSDAKDLNIYNIYDGIVVKIIENGKDDHGLGNTIIIEHNIDNEKFYSLYGHLESINENLQEGQFIKGGEVVGKVGATGYGCDYWRIGEDGCDKKGKLDLHLHFEIKTKPVLESPTEVQCFINGSYKKCYGYTPENPTKYGYFDPLKFISE